MKTCAAAASATVILLAIAESVLLRKIEQLAAAPLSKSSVRQIKAREEENYVRKKKGEMLSLCDAGNQESRLSLRNISSLPTTSCKDS